MKVESTRKIQVYFDGDGTVELHPTKETAAQGQAEHLVWMDGSFQQLQSFTLKKGEATEFIHFGTTEKLREKDILGSSWSLDKMNEAKLKTLDRWIRNKKIKHNVIRIKA